MKNITLPDDIYKAIQQRLPKTEFRTVDDYAAYVLQEVVKKIAEEGKTQEYTKEDEEKVKARLKSLGYLE